MEGPEYGCAVVVAGEVGPVGDGGSDGAGEGWGDALGEGEGEVAKHGG